MAAMLLLLLFHHGGGGGGERRSGSGSMPSPTHHRHLWIQSMHKLLGHLGSVGKPSDGPHFKIHGWKKKNNPLMSSYYRCTNLPLGTDPHQVARWLSVLRLQSNLPHKTSFNVGESKLRSYQTRIKEKGLVQQFPN